MQGKKSKKKNIMLILANNGIRQMLKFYEL